MRLPWGASTKPGAVHVVAEDACFHGASLPFCNASHGVFIRADFSGSDLTTVVFVESNCSQVSFKDACCHAARFAFTDLHEVDWNGADLGMATGPEANVAAPLPFVEPAQSLLAYVAGGDSGGIHSVAYSQDGQLILTGGSDGSARLWDAASGRELHRFEGHGGSVWSVAFAPSGGQVLTGGADGSARLWDVETGACLLRLYVFDGNGFDEPSWLSLDARDRYRGNAAGIARLSYVDPDDLSLMPTHWHPEDLPHLQAPDPEAPGGD